MDLGGVAKIDPQVMLDMRKRYGLEMDLGSVPGLIERFRLSMSVR